MSTLSFRVKLLDHLHDHLIHALIGLFGTSYHVLAWKHKNMTSSLYQRVSATTLQECKFLRHSVLFHVLSFRDELILSGSYNHIMYNKTLAVLIRPNFFFVFFFFLFCFCVFVFFCFVFCFVLFLVFVLFCFVFGFCFIFFFVLFCFVLFCFVLFGCCCCCWFFFFCFFCFCFLFFVLFSFVLFLSHNVYTDNV